MAKVLIVHIIPEGGGRASVGHMFYGETEAECRENLAAHAKGCEFLTPAIAEDRIDEELAELAEDEWPDFEDPEAGPVIDVPGGVVDEDDDEGDDDET